MYLTYVLKVASSSRVAISLGPSFSAIMERRIQEWGKSAKGGGFSP